MTFEFKTRMTFEFKTRNVRVNVAPCHAFILLFAKKKSNYILTCTISTTLYHETA